MPADTTDPCLHYLAPSKVHGVYARSLLQSYNLAILTSDDLRGVRPERLFHELADLDLPPRKQDFSGWMVGLLLHLLVKCASVVVLHLIELIYACYSLIG